jgi:four helix bundle protein
MLRIYDTAVSMIREMRPAIEAIERKDRDLGRQLRRAASSVVLNIAEGSGCCGGTRKQRYRDALGSAREVGGCIDIARAFGYVDIRARGLPEIIGTLVNVTR